jgi:hypothetical protein
VRPLTMMHRVVVGQEMAVAPEAPASDAVDQGSCSSDQVEPFQSRTAVPTTAVHDELEGQESPIPPG